MRILIISQYFPPDITAASFRIYDIAKLLTQKKHEVCVITAYPHKAQAKNQKTDALDLGSITVCRSRTSKIGSGGFVNYLKHYFSFMFGSIWIGLKWRLHGWKPDIIWASSPPLFVGLSGLVLSKLFRCPFVLDVRDVWPDFAVSAGQISSDGLAYRIGKRIEKYIYNCSDYITCVAKPMREYIAANTQKTISVVYNGVLEQDVGLEVKPNTLCKSNGTRTILYTGNLGRVQQLDLLIHAYAELVEEGYMKNWNIRFIGAGALEDNLRELVSELQLDDNISIAPPVTREVALQQSKAADLLFLSLLPDVVLKMTIPSKVFDYMLAGKPILAGIFGEGKDILESTKANVCYNPGDLQTLKQALVKTTTRHSDLAKLANKNRDLVLSKYTRQMAASMLLDVFDNL